MLLSYDEAFLNHVIANNTKAQGCIQKHCNINLELQLLRPFYDPLSGLTQVSRYQKINHSGFC